MKHLTAYLLIAAGFLALTCAACTGGFVDPGAGGGGSGSDPEGLGGLDKYGEEYGGGSYGEGTYPVSVSKPSTLSSGASVSDALAKLGEIISYCQQRPGNETVRYEAETYQSLLKSASAYSDAWYSTASENIAAINALIGSLS